MRRRRWLWTATILLACVGYQILVHSAVTGAQPGPIRIALTILPLLVLACWVAMRSRNKPAWLLVLLLAGTATYLLVGRDVWGLAAAYGVSHAAIYLALLGMFGRTLWPGREPLITRLAHRVHGELRPDLKSVYAAPDLRVVCLLCGPGGDFGASVPRRLARQLVVLHQSDEFPAARSDVRGRISLSRRAPSGISTCQYSDRDRSVPAGRQTAGYSPLR